MDLYLLVLVHVRTPLVELKLIVGFAGPRSGDEAKCLVKATKNPLRTLAAQRGPRSAKPLDRAQTQVAKPHQEEATPLNLLRIAPVQSGNSRPCHGMLGCGCWGCWGCWLGVLGMLVMLVILVMLVMLAMLMMLG